MRYLILLLSGCVAEASTGSPVQLAAGEIVVVCDPETGIAPPVQAIPGALVQAWACVDGSCFQVDVGEVDGEWAAGCVRTTTTIAYRWLAPR